MRNVTHKIPKRLSDLDNAVFQENLSKFAQSASREASKVFKRLDPSLEPQVFVLAIPFDLDSNPVQLIPESDNYPVDRFRSIHGFIEDICESDLIDLAFDVRGVVWQTKVDVKVAIQEILTNDSSESLYESFTTFPEFMYGHSVSLILQLSRTALASHYTLSKHARWGFPAASLIYETISAFLYTTLAPLEKLARGQSWFRLNENGDDLFRRAGFWLMKGVESACKTEESELITENLFRPCNVISSLPYEGNEGRGEMIISTKGHPNIEVALELDAPLKPSNYRGIRKLLEMTSTGLNLLCDCSSIYGFGKLNHGPYDEDQEDLFTIQFTSHYQWKLFHTDEELMVVTYGIPNLPTKPINRDSFSGRLRALFKQVSDENVKDLSLVIQRAIQQKHGTMLVISDEAEKEAGRLRKQSTLIRPVRLIPELILPISSIDGAILIDPQNTCYAIGVILDGMASERGSRARGARYNSAIRYLDYVKSLNRSCIIIVISEDGMVDLLASDMN
jgi:DNA integrity scanning protein DisA with diadenylate cyclase activity